MIGNKCYLTDYEDYDGGFVSFGDHETVYKEWEDIMERAATTASSLEVEQGSGNITRTESMATLNEPFPQGTSSGSGPRYALTVNPTVYALCIKQFWTAIKARLKFDDAEAPACLPNDTIFAELTRMGYEKPSQKLTFYKAFFSPQWKFLIHTILQCLSAKTTAWNEFSSTMAFAIICLANNQIFNFSKYIFNNMVKHLEGGVKFLMFLRFLQVFMDKQVKGMAKHKEVYVMSSYTKKIFAIRRRQRQGFSGNVTPLFETMMVIAQDKVSEGSDLHTYSHHTPTDTQPSTSEPHKKMKPKRKQRQAAEVHSPSTEIPVEESVPTPSNDPLPSKEKTTQAKEIAKLKKRVKTLENRRKSRPAGLRRLNKVGSSSQVESSEEKVSLGAQEDASKQGRSIKDIDLDAYIALVDESRGRMQDADMFGVDDLEGEENSFHTIDELERESKKGKIEWLIEQ
nr:hypothetical protein [Tanacetum cinerariifolium]